MKKVDTDDENEIPNCCRKFGQQVVIEARQIRRFDETRTPEERIVSKQLPCIPKKYKGISGNNAESTEFEHDLNLRKNEMPDCCMVEDKAVCYPDDCPFKQKIPTENENVIERRKLVNFRQSTLNKGKSADVVAVTHRTHQEDAKYQYPDIQTEKNVFNVVTQPIQNKKCLSRLPKPQQAERIETWTEKNNSKGFEEQPIKKVPVPSGFNKNSNECCESNSNYELKQEVVEYCDDASCQIKTKTGMNNKINHQSQIVQTSTLEPKTISNVKNDRSSKILYGQECCRPDYEHQQVGLINKSVERENELINEKNIQNSKMFCSMDTCKLIDQKIQVTCIPFWKGNKKTTFVPCQFNNSDPQMAWNTINLLSYSDCGQRQVQHPKTNKFDTFSCRLNKYVMTSVDGVSIQTEDNVNSKTVSPPIYHKYENNKKSCYPDTCKLKKLKTELNCDNSTCPKQVDKDHGQVAQSAEYMCSVMETYQKIFEPREYHCPLCKSAINIKSKAVAEKISQFCCDKYIRPVEETNQKRICPNPQDINKKSTSTQFAEDAFPQNKTLPGNKQKCCIRINDDARVLSEYKTRGPPSSIKFGPERTKASGTQPSCCYENSASRTVIKKSSNKLPKLEDREMVIDNTPQKSIDAEVYVNNVPPQLVNEESSNNIQESNSKSTSGSLLNIDNNQDVSNMNCDSLPPNENSQTEFRGRSRDVMLSKSGMAKEIPSCCYENKPNNRTTSFTQAEKSSNEIHKEDVVDDQLVLTSSDSRMKSKDSFKSERISKQVPSCCFKNKSADYTSLSLPIKEVVSSTEAERDESSKESYEDRQSSSEVVPAVDQLPSNENSKSKFNEPSGDLIISRSELTKSSEQTTSSSCTDPHLRISDVKMNDDNAQRKGKSSDDIPFESASYEDNQCTTDSPYVTFYGNSQVIMKEPSDAAKSQLPSCCHKKESGVSRSASVARNNYPEAPYDERREIVRTPSQFIDDLISNSRVVIETFNLKPGYFPQKEPVRQKCPDHRLPRNRNSPGCCSCLSSHSIEELL